MKVSVIYFFTVVSVYISGCSHTKLKTTSPKFRDLTTLGHLINGFLFFRYVRTNSKIRFETPVYTIYNNIFLISN